MLKLSALFSLYFSDNAISHVLLSLCKQWQKSKLETRVIVPSCDPVCELPYIVQAIHPKLSWFYYRNPEAPQRIAEKRFLKELKRFDAAYLWPGTSLKTALKTKQQDKPIFLERVNNYTGRSKAILDQAYKHLGVEPQHAITIEAIQHEKTEVELADYLFCPSLEVKQSFLELGVPEQKLILTSEGWCPDRFPNTSVDWAKKQAAEDITVLCIGNSWVRKGVHLLLRAWNRAGIKGRLGLLGVLDPVIAETCGEILARPDVIHHGWQKDYTTLYREADIFALPSLEEGSPLVTYEAMAHGLPMLVSPMGGGGMVRDGIDGIVLPPYDEDAWVEALRKLASSANLRQQMGTAAQQRIQSFTWEKVANRRAALIRKKLNSSNY
jgi:glycosyltransferase involved in cell wall biosynthesis